MKFIPKSGAGRAILGLIVLALLVAAWFLASPLFIDRTVNEEFPVAEAGTVMDEAMPGDADPVLLAKGNFVDADAIHQGTGEASIYRLDDGRLILRFEEFDVTNGPDLYVWLSNAGEGSDADAIKASRTIELEPLKGNIGNQNYVLPAAIDLDDVRSVVIWCRAFGVLFSQATLDNS